MRLTCTISVHPERSRRMFGTIYHGPEFSPFDSSARTVWVLALGCPREVAINDSTVIGVNSKGSECPNRRAIPSRWVPYHPFMVTKSFGVKRDVWGMSICLCEWYTKREMRRWDYEYYRFYVIWKSCFARLAEVFIYRAYSYLSAAPAEYTSLDV